MNLINIPVFLDNYVWLLYDKHKFTIIVDPGIAEPVLDIIDKNNFIPIAILLTHNHNDHVGGVKNILKYFNIPVYGPKETEKKGTNKILYENDNFTLLHKKFYIIFLPGHTMNHIGYYCPPWLFCGDTIFSAGCGRIFEGNFKKMYESIQKIKKLPSKTIICPGHEYTLNNLNFSISILPRDNFIKKYKKKIIKIRLNNKSSLPTSLYIEKKINLFFRCNDITLKKALNTNLNKEWLIFKLLRKRKDFFG